MLNAGRVPRACQSCRVELLSIFANSLAVPLTVKTLHPRAPFLRTRNLQTRNFNAVRKISTTRFRGEELKQDGSGTASQSTADIQDVVRQARQTFGETLPKDYLSAEEYALYERLYGPPLRETKAEDLEYLPEGEEEGDEKTRNVLLRLNDDGEYEEVEFDPSLGFSVTEHAEADLEAAAEFAGEDSLEEGVELQDDALLDVESENGREEAVVLKQPSTVQVVGQNQREIDAIARLQLDMDAAAARAVEEEEEELDEEFDDEEMEEDEEYEEDETDAYLSSDGVRTHPHTLAGRFGTFPSTLSLPKQEMIDPVTELLERTNMKHLTESAERSFGGKGIPHSPSTRSVKGPTPQKHIGLDASQHKMTELEADTYLAAFMPQTYASVMSALVEVRKRLGSDWIRGLLFRDGGEVPRVLDAGAGGAAAIAWREVLQAEWDVLKEEGIVKAEQVPTGKTTVLTGSTTLRNRVSRFIDNTTFLPRLPDYIHSSRSEALLDGSPAQERKVFDIIIAPHTLFALKEDFRRRNMVQNLWSLLDPNGGVLILIEKGIPRGFEAIAGARSLLLESHISSPGETPLQDEIQPSNKKKPRAKEEGMIIAPCTNHKTCPMYPVHGLSSGRKDFCHFNQRFIRPGYLQRVLGASLRNHEDVKYSYIAVRRGVDARKDTANPPLQGDAATDRAFEGYETEDLTESETPIDAESADIKLDPLSLPRIILPSLKRRGHVTMDVCTPSGQLERWTIPKSFSKVAHRDARKSKWGDLWALGAKTRVSRSPRLGKLSVGGDGKSKTGVKGIRDGRIGKGGKKARVNKFDIIMGADGMKGIEPSRGQSKFVKQEKRTKGGRIWKEPKPFGEDDL